MSDQLEGMDGRDIIIGLRGMPEKCDYCEETDANKLEPLSGGEWACWACLDRWAKDEDDRAAGLREGEKP